MTKYPSIAADIQAASAAFLAGTTWVVQLETWLQIGATAAAIAAAITAAWFHVEKALTLRQQRKEKDEDGSNDSESDE